MTRRSFAYRLGYQQGIRERGYLTEEEMVAHFQQPRGTNWRLSYLKGVRAGRRAVRMVWHQWN